MKHYETDRIKNIVLAGGSKSGKTTLAECMMFEGGVLSRMGKVDAGNTVSDYHEIELERGSSVFSSVLHTEWRGTKINLIDTPGLDDFSGELIGALRVCDTALITLNAQYGVEVGTEIVWRYLKTFHKPGILLINQVDHPKADFHKSLEMARRQFGDGIILVQYPYNQGEEFDSIIDLLKMVMYQFPKEGGKPKKLPIPPEERERAQQLHTELVEAAAEHDDSLMELYFEKGELDEDEMRKGIRLGMLQRSLFPVFCLSSLRNMGSGRLMGFIGNVAPSAGDLTPEKTTEGVEIASPDGETTLFVFKTSNERHTGSMTYFKVCSGELQVGMELYNAHTQVKGKLNQLFVVDGKNRHTVPRLAAGDIGATVKLKNTYTNHTLRSVDDGVEVEPIIFPEPRIRTAIELVNDHEEEKLAQAMAKLHAGDPTLIPEYSSELKQTLLHGQGALHLQVNQWILEHVYGVKISFAEPRISYRETIQSEAKGYYKHKKQSGGAGQYAEVYLLIKPYQDLMSHPEELKIRGEELVELDWGGKMIFYNCIVGGVIDQRFLPAILKGIQEIMEEGPITGSYVRDVAIYVYDGKMHPVDSNEISFKIAGQQAFKKAFMDANPLILEPIYHVNIYIPDEYMGEVLTDLQARRAIVEGFNNEGAYQHITAKVPLSMLNRYATNLSSITQGRGTHSRHFYHYQVVPGNIQAELIQKSIIKVA